MLFIYVLLAGNPDSTANIFPDPEAKYPATLLYSGSFHKGEVPENAKNMSWLGLFFDGTTCSLQKTKPEFSNEHDPILDKDKSIKTGIKVMLKGKSPLLLFSGVDIKVQKETDFVDIRGNEAVLPGAVYTFLFKNSTHTIIATGTGDKPDNIKNYKLFLKSEKNGKFISQLICSQPFLDGNMPSLVFIGDIDNDQRPDLIINNSHHYNVGRLTLYLSSFAEKRDLVKVMGMLTKTGC